MSPGVQDKCFNSSKPLYLYNGNKVHLLSKIIGRIEKELRSTIPYPNSLGPDVFQDPEHFFFWNLGREDGGNTTYFISLQ